MKKLIAFDLDGTLTESKTDIDAEMVDLLTQLQKIKMVAVIGGASFKQFQKQFLNYHKFYENLYIMPTSGASLYKYENGQWQVMYQALLTPDEKQQIFEAFDKALKEINYEHPVKTYGQIIEDRECEVVFSTLGQEAPLSARLSLKFDRRPEIINAIKSIWLNLKSLCLVLTQLMLHDLELIKDLPSNNSKLFYKLAKTKLFLSVMLFMKAATILR